MSEPTTIGFSEFTSKLGTLPDAIKALANKEVDDVAAEWAVRAKQSALGFADRGSLAGGITSAHADDMQAEVYSNMSYSPFVEWGTGKKVQVPPNVTGYASQFVGYKGEPGEVSLFEAILGWVKRKGVTGTYSVKTKRRLGSKSVQEEQDSKAAFLISWSIRHNGIKPHPFFFIHKDAMDVLLQQRIQQNIVKEL